MKLFLIIIGVILSIATSSVQAGTVWYPLPKEAYKFGEMYPEAQSLLYAFDYGHALVYERLLLKKGTIDDPAALEKEILSEIMAILKNPPNVKVDEEDIAPNYVYKFPLMVDVFDWSHMLHQFILDVMATSTDRGDGMWKRINEINDQYKVNTPIVITDVCKTMLFMDGHYFSKSFRRSFPSFNLLIWSYHWFQIKLYEALLQDTRAKRDQAVQQTVADFWNLVSDLPDSADFDMMPSTFKDAPMFSAMVPGVAASFDNNHMLHDIVSDILVSPKVDMSSLRAEGLRFARMAMDPTAFKANKCDGN